jgi:hypothetical protein
LKDDCAFHNAHKDEDRSIDLPCGQLTDNVGISKSSLELEQVNVNFLVAIQHSGTGSVWCNPDMKGDILFISDTSFVLVVPDFFPRSDDWLGKRKLNFICT